TDPGECCLIRIAVWIPCKEKRFGERRFHDRLEICAISVPRKRGELGLRFSPFRQQDATEEIAASAHPHQDIGPASVNDIKVPGVGFDAALEDEQGAGIDDSDLCRRAPRRYPQ